MGGAGSACLGAAGGAQKTGASGMSDGFAETVPQRVAEVGRGEVSLHPNDSIVQLTILRYQEGVKWEAAASGFVVKDEGCIITAGHSVSRGSDQQAHGRVSRIEMVWKGRIALYIALVKVNS